VPRAGPVERCAALALSAVLVPLAFIAAAALASGWFRLLENALSDLGHATRSNVAPLFNFGLAAGGFLLAAHGLTCAVRRSPHIGATLAAAGFLLTLVAVFDEVYGRLHFYVSVAFFLSLAVLLAEYAAWSRGARRALALLALAVGAASWALHLGLGVPRGAALPELVSVGAALPFYFDFALRKG